MTESPTPAPLPLGPLAKALGDPLRWRILAELSTSEPLMVKELAERLHRSKTAVSKHLAVLRAGGAVEIGRGRLYQIPAAYRVSPGRVDFGTCLLRF